MPGIVKQRSYNEEMIIKIILWDFIITVLLAIRVMPTGRSPVKIPAKYSE